MPRLEDVFKTSGQPTYTFVEPRKYEDILLSLRTPGRCLVVEGPSGIGKTTAIEKALEIVGISGRTTKLSARRREDVEYIEFLPEIKKTGIVLVDDFHRLSEDTQSHLADYIKVLADTEEKDTKIVVLGINRAGDNLIKFASDLVNRVDIVRFETETDEKIKDLIKKGEEALNVCFNVTDEIVKEARGSFYLAQMLCREICLASKILEKLEDEKTLDVSFESVRTAVWTRLSLTFGETCKKFCRGTKFRPGGRAPYLHILRWLATEETWTLDLREAGVRHPELRGSVTQIVDKDFLNSLIKAHPDISRVLHFNKDAALLTIEDPQFLFYIRNVPWRQFSKDLGFHSVSFGRRYDFALSFAGSDRDLAEALFHNLAEVEVEVFYDKHEQHRILAEDIEEYLGPIYRSEAQFVVVLLGRDYPSRIWTKFESEAFKDRLGEGSVIPIRFADVDESMFDKTRYIGGLVFDRSQDFGKQVHEFSELLLKKLADSRQLPPAAVATSPQRD